MKKINKLITLYIILLIVAVFLTLFLFFTQTRREINNDVKEDIKQVHVYIEKYINNTFTSSINNYFIALADKTLFDISNLSYDDALESVKDFKFKLNGYIYITDKYGTILSHPDPRRIGSSSVVSDWINIAEKRSGFTRYKYLGKEKYLYKTYSKKHNFNIIVSSYVSDFTSIININSLENYVKRLTDKHDINVYILTDLRKVILHPKYDFGSITTEAFNSYFIEDQFYFDEHDNRYGYYSQNNFFNWVIAVSGEKDSLTDNRVILSRILKQYIPIVALFIMFLSLIFLRLISGLRLQEKNIEIINTQKELLYKLGETVETRSKETSTHVKRVSFLSEFLAKKYGLNKNDQTIIKSASPLHDIGKIGIPDNILHKPGKLTPTEFESMKQHTTIGYNILKGSEKPLLKASAIIANEHHEYWDGSGYPSGIKENKIHIYARIVNVADVIDALLSKRSYKEPWPSDKVFSFILKQKAIMFDPDLVDIVLNNREKILKIIDEIRETEELYNY